jgi:hypothetical protein
MIKLYKVSGFESMKTLSGLLIAALLNSFHEDAKRRHLLKTKGIKIRPKAKNTTDSAA